MCSSYPCLLICRTVGKNTLYILIVSFHINYYKVHCVIHVISTDFDSFRAFQRIKEINFSLLLYKLQ